MVTTPRPTGRLGGLHGRPFHFFLLKTRPLSGAYVSSPRLRTIVYVDGFNLYYGAVKGTPYKWLNLQRYFTLLRPHDDLILIRYFTALIDGPRRPNQDRFLRALSTLPKVEVILGRFKHKQVECHYADCQMPGRRFFRVREEKRTDVNIAVYIVDDAHQDRC
ncbi:MAG: NYN domain-containing protein, partial [Luteitalea sp.]|nr:NYN domain-containing protein [Luteitalea sp.]